MLGGIPIHFHVQRFGNTSNIAPSIPVVEVRSYVIPRPSASSPIQIREPRRVTVQNTTYIVSHVPSSSIPSSSNAIPPPHSRGPSGWNVAMSHVRIAATHVVVSQSQVPPVVREVVFLLLEVMLLLPECLFLLMVFLMGHLTGFLMDLIMDHSMDRFIHLMGTAIRNPLTF